MAQQNTEQLAANALAAQSAKEELVLKRDAYAVQQLKAKLAGAQRG
ncbi:hypothetical protein [Malikia spinosa]|nr:hypothetical protein [Malikia spinosa]